MVPAHKKSQNGSALLATKIPGEAAQFFELLRTFECIQVAFVSQRLEVATTEDYINLLGIYLLPLLELLVYSIHLTVEASNLSDYHRKFKPNIKFINN